MRGALAGFGYMPNGDLIIKASNEMRSALAYEFGERGYYGAESVVLEHLRAAGLDIIPPENVAALTDAPIIAEADYPDDGSGPVPFPDAPVWWFPQYQFIDPWERLKNTGRVVFTKASE